MPSRIASRFRRLGFSSDATAGLRSLGWSYFGHGLQLVLKIGSSLILTRLLAPEVYGIFGPALAVTFFLEFLADIGLRPAIGRSPNGESPEFLGTAWTIVQIRAVLLAVATGGLSLLLPGLYEKPGLMPVLAVLCFRPFVLAWHNPTIYVLYRRLNYRPGFILDVTQTVVAVPVTIVLAAWMQNVWALVLGLLIGDVYRLVMSHIVCPRAPRFRWHKPSVAELSGFGSSILLNTLVFGTWIYFDRLTGAKVLTEQQLGLYTVAWTLAEALDNLVARAGDVFYSLLSRKEDAADRQRITARTLWRAALIVPPCIAVGAIVAPFVFRLLYQQPFHATGLLLGILITRLILRTISTVQFMYLMMLGEVFVATRAYLASLALLVTAFVGWGLCVGWDQFTPTFAALSAVGGMATYTLFQTIHMVRRREISPWPFAIGVCWTAIAILGVLLISG